MTDPFESPLERTQRLARRVLDGEVVFFVGSGFSVDSEGNTAGRLVGRLLAALLSMAKVLDDGPLANSEGCSLLDGLGRVFGLAGAERAGEAAREPARCMTRDNLEKLAREYYNFNDWAVSALGVLSGELLDCPEGTRDALADHIQRFATFLLAFVGDTVPLDAIDWRALAGFESPFARGKALFLDVMGFANASIMGGSPSEPDDTLVAQSYADKLRPRHHVLARLAREGLAPAMVTTNYDLLLEGAYRLAGFAERNLGPEPNQRAEGSVRFTRIAGADQFFARGTGYRSALLLKIHGCAEHYRTARNERLAALSLAAKTENGVRDAPTRNVWADYLPALVFTYREIQTWRADAWSRDLMRTLLRTHTIALCGYSGADPVMHSTFREVYEEKQSQVEAAADVSARNASVFFYGLSGRREFHSFEILRAATTAAGLEYPRKLVDHPNHVEFERAGFPSIDDHFRWLMHGVVRQRQSEAVQTRLRKFVHRLLRRQCRDKEIEILEGLMAEQRRREDEAVARFRDPDPKLPEAERLEILERQRKILERIVGWTWYFVPGLLRELYLAESIDNRLGGALLVKQRRTTTYYHPISEHPEWAAWALVLEFALRRLVAALSEKNELDASVVAEETPHAAVSFADADSLWRPSALCVRLAGFDPPSRTPPLVGAFHRVTYWEFGENDAPWPRKPAAPCPRASELWGWALGLDPPTREQARRHLGLSP